MSLWWCDDCKIAFAPGPACPRCGKGGVWQRIGDAIGEAETLRRIMDRARRKSLRIID